jgi:N-acetylglucosamine malate deacetylase 1
LHPDEQDRTQIALKLPESVLVLSPHTDDGEFGSGGTIARLLRERSDVAYVAFSSAEESVPPGFPKGILRRECLNATRTLGIEPETVRILRFKVRKFPSQRQEILETIIKLNKEFKPQLVLVPSSNDVHQDHHVIYEEALRAFKTSASIWGYEHPWNNLSFSTDALVRLDLRDVERKILALKCYKSQSSRAYLNDDYLVGLMRTRGTLINSQFAEGYEVVRMLLK